MESLLKLNRQLARFVTNQGYSLIELMLVIIVVAIIASISMKSLKGVNNVARVEETKKELDLLAYAIAGNPNLVSAGVRTDYGYVGDVGALPPNLDALVTNPGSYATWDGEYIKDKLSTGGADIYFKSDAWGKSYAYTAGNTISSSGGSSTITRELATSTAALTSNSVSTVITDINNAPPGSVFKDSVDVVLEYPDGAGNLTTSTKNPAQDGFVQFTTIPIGIHKLLVIYLPTNDTLTRYANVDPGLDYFADLSLSSSFSGESLSSGSLQYLPGTAKATGACDKIEFKIINMSVNNIAVNSITITWSTPTAYYKKVDFEGSVFDNDNPRAGSGDVASFSGSKTVNAGETITVKVEEFRDVQSGAGNTVDMSNTTMTVTFSDGSTFEINTGVCQ